MNIVYDDTAVGKLDRIIWTFVILYVKFRNKI